MTEATLEAQEQAANSGCVLFPLRDWTILSITGPDRHSFLHCFCTNDIKGMAADSVCEAFITNVKGRILAHVLVLNEPEQLTLLAAPGLADALLKHLQIYLIGLDAELRDVSASTFHSADVPGRSSVRGNCDLTYWFGSSQFAL
ncbi:MAG: hypothetical protein KDA88_06780 [Planctomycetaceae bacterium]|nr:hypothetical protein [Planctomycetaceae bacterium]